MKDKILGFGIVLAFAAAICASISWQVIAGFGVGVVVTVGAAIITAGTDEIDRL